MLVNRGELHNEIREIIGEFAHDKKVKASVGKYFIDKGMFEAEALNIFAQRTPLETLSDLVIGIFISALYEVLGKDYNRINPSKYFTENEILVINNYKTTKKENAKFPVIFEDIKQLNDNQWYTHLTAQQISELYAKRIITYNSETQRQLKTVVKNDKIITKIDINKKSVQEIKQRILDGKFISNFITINILENGMEEFYFTNDNLKIMAGELSIIDGFHRSLAIIEAIQENPNLEFNIGVVITHFDKEVAQRFIVQEDQRNKINSKYIKSLDAERKSNIIVKKINESSNSYLKGKITTDSYKLKTKQALIMFDVLSDSIDLVFKPKENIDIINYSKYIIDGLNLIIEDNTKLLEECKYEKLWISYIVILKELYGIDNWEDSLLSMVRNLNIDDIQYNYINTAMINRIKRELF